MTARRDTPAPLDLLQQRRLHRGLPSTPQRPSPAGPLLRRGAALGAVPLVLVLALALAMQGRRWHLASQAEALSAVPAQRQLLDSRLQRVRRQLRQLERSNGALVRGIVAVQSGSALLTELQRVTPIGVQISALQVQGDQLQLKGAAADPGAFRRVNGLQLLLGASPLFQRNGVTVGKLSRDKPTEPLAWEITARFAPLQPAQQLTVLAQLQADGLARRMQVLQRAGVLP